MLDKIEVQISGDLPDHGVYEWEWEIPEGASVIFDGCEEGEVKFKIRVTDLMVSKEAQDG